MQLQFTIDCLQGQLVNRRASMAANERESANLAAELEFALANTAEYQKELEQQVF